MMLGRMWRVTIRSPDAPEARAASTNSFSLTERQSPRTTRAMGIQNRSERLPIIRVEGLTRPTTHSSLPVRPFWIMARTAMPGTIRNRSVTRIRIESTTPPMNPETEPTATPTTVLTSATSRPTLSETRAAKRSRVRTSRPSSSVPNQCRPFGGSLKLASVSARTGLSGWGATCSANRAKP